MLPWEHPEKVPPRRGISAVGHFPATQKQEARQELLPIHTHYSRTGQWLKKITSWHPPSSDRSHAPASRDASVPLWLWQEMPHMHWIPYLEKGPPSHRGSTLSGQISCKWTLRDELVAGKYRAGTLDVSWGTTSCWQQGKLLVSTWFSVLPALGLHHPWLEFCEDENTRTERCHCSPSPAAPGVGWVWTQSIVPDHTKTLPANLPTCHGAILSWQFHLISTHLSPGLCSINVSLAALALLTAPSSTSLLWPTAPGSQLLTLRTHSCPSLAAPQSQQCSARLWNRKAAKPLIALGSRLRPPASSCLQLNWHIKAGRGKCPAPALHPCQPPPFSSLSP